MQKKSILHAMTMRAFHEAAFAVGQNDWERFVAKAKSSCVPSEFLALSQSAGEDHTLITSIVFKTSFRNDEVALYAVTYASAMACIKAWQEFTLNLAAYQDKLETVKKVQEELNNELIVISTLLRCSVEDIPTSLDAMSLPSSGMARALKFLPEMQQSIVEIQQKIVDTTKDVANFQKLAQASCGVVLLLENKATPPNVKDFWRWVKWHVKRLRGQKATLRDLELARDWVEKFCATEFGGKPVEATATA